MIEMSALRRSKEDSFLYRMIISQVKVELEVPSKYRVQNVYKELTWLVNCLTNGISDVHVPKTLFFRMLKTAGLYLVPIKSYSKNTHPPFVLEWALEHIILATEHCKVFRESLQNVPGWRLYNKKFDGRIHSATNIINSYRCVG